MNLQPLPNTRGIVRQHQQLTLTHLTMWLDSIHIRQATVHYKVKPVIHSGHSCSKHSQAVSQSLLYEYDLKKQCLPLVFKIDTTTLPLHSPLEQHAMKCL